MPLLRSVCSQTGGWDNFCAMRTYPIVLALLLAGSTALAAQKRPNNTLSEFKTDDFSTVNPSKRRGPGVDVQGFGAKEAPKEKPFPWKGIGLASLVLLVAFPFGFRMYRSTRQDLEDQATFGLKGSAHEREEKAKGGDKGSRRSPTRKKAEAAKPAADAEPVADARDAVWGAISSANNWVGADWVASSAGIPVGQASSELSTLVEEGYVEETRDRSNKPVYRIAS